MDRWMNRLSELISRRRRWILLGWVVIILAAAPFSLRQTDHLTDGGFATPGSQSHAVDQQIERLPVAGPNAIVVLSADENARAGALESKVTQVRQVAASVPHVRPAPERASGTPGLAYVDLTLEGGFDERVDTAVLLRAKLKISEGPKDGVRTYLVGPEALWAALHDLQKEDLSAAEQVGFPLILIILLAVLGSFTAAILPLVLGAVSVTLTGALIYLLSQLTDMSVFVVNAASMIGIGVAVDYSLFMLARYRQEIAAGAAPEEAQRRMLRTSGTTVAFSGITVMVCLSGVLLVDSTVLRSMALGIIVVIVLSILGAVTLLPALIGVLGKRVGAEGVPRRLLNRLRWRSARARDGTGRDFWGRWVARVTARPVLSVVGASAVMLVLAVPALWIDLNDRAADQFPQGHETRVGVELAQRTLSPGELAPIPVLIAFDKGVATDPANRQATDSYLASVRVVNGVVRVVEPQPVPGTVFPAATRACPLLPLIGSRPPP